MSSQIIEGDCLEVLPTLADQSVDCVFTDPPYGLEFNNGDLAHKREEALGVGPRGEPRPISNDTREWFTNVLPQCFAEMSRILRCGGCCCCCCGGGGPQPLFAEMTLALDRTPGFEFKQAVVWDKGGLGMGWHYRRSYEFVLIAQKKGAACKWHDESHRVSNLIRIPKIIPAQDQHPTEKPSALAAFFIRLHSQEGDTVLDPFCGSGSTGEAALCLGRNFIGIDVEASYVAIARARCEQAERQRQPALPM